MSFLAHLKKFKSFYTSVLLTFPHGLQAVATFLGDAFSVALLVVSVRHEMARRQLLLCVAVTLLASSTCYQVKKKILEKK